MHKGITKYVREIEKIENARQDAQSFSSTGDKAPVNNSSSLRAKLIL